MRKTGSKKAKNHVLKFFGARERRKKRGRVIGNMQWVQAIQTCKNTDLENLYEKFQNPNSIWRRNTNEANSKKDKRRLKI